MIDIKYTVHNKGVNIVDSYLMNDIDKMYEFIFLQINWGNLETNRTIKNCIAEWLFHNWCYKHHIMRKHSKDTFIDNELNGLRGTVEKIIYKIIEKML